MPGCQQNVDDIVEAVNEGKKLPKQIYNAVRNIF